MMSMGVKLVLMTAVAVLKMLTGCRWQWRLIANNTLVLEFVAVMMGLMGADSGGGIDDNGEDDWCGDGRESCGGIDVMAVIMGVMGWRLVEC